MTATIAAFFFADRILERLIAPIRGDIGTFYFFSPAEAFLVKIRVAFLTGLVLSSPVVLGQIWFFVAPGLRDRERKIIVPLSVATSALFVTGVVFAYTAVVPLALRFLVGGMQSEFLRPMISIDHYIGFVSGLLLAFGVAFNLPVGILVLGVAGFLSSGTLWRYQRHAVIIIFILAAVLTPGPDIASQLLLGIPLFVLFELSVAGVKFIELFRAKKEVAG